MYNAIILYTRFKKGLQGLCSTWNWGSNEGFLLMTVTNPIKDLPVLFLFMLSVVHVCIINLFKI